MEADQMVEPAGAAHVLPGMQAAADAMNRLVAHG